MTRPGPVFHSLVASVVLTASSIAWGEPRSPDTFEYTTPTEKNYLRAVLELEALTTLSVIWYVVDVRQGGDVGYRWQIFERKLTGAALAHDDNAFGTNFRGHGLGGNAYYLSARSNHLGIAESFGYAVAGSVSWEYFGEISEVVSANDLIVTPFTGIAVGEPLTQLGAYFDRRAPTFANRLLGSVFGPLKTVNDALDGARLSRDSSRAHDWHRFWLSASAGVTRSELASPQRTAVDHGTARLELGERLARLPDYGGPGEHSQTFADGNVSGMSVRIAVGDRGFSDFAFHSHVVPFGYYARNTRSAPDGLHGSSVVVGFELGYRYLVHRYLDGPSDILDRAAFVEPAGLMVEANGDFGPFRVTTRLDALAAYGGVHPLASRAFGAERDALPSVLRQFDYYFGAGGELEASLLLGFRRFEASASLLGRRFVCVDEHARLPISDSFERYESAISYQLQPGWSVHLFAETGVRAGRLGEARARARETSSGFGLSANF